MRAGLLTRLAVHNGARESIRNSNLLILSQAPLPIGLHGQTGATDPTRTDTDRGLSPTPLPLGYSRILVARRGDDPRPPP